MHDLCIAEKVKDPGLSFLPLMVMGLSSFIHLYTASSRCVTVTAVQDHLKVSKLVRWYQSKGHMRLSIVGLVFHCNYVSKNIVSIFLRTVGLTIKSFFSGKWNFRDNFCSIFLIYTVFIKSYNKCPKSVGLDTGPQSFFPLVYYHFDYSTCTLFEVGSAQTSFCFSSHVSGFRFVDSLLLLWKPRSWFWANLKRFSLS